MSDIGPGKRTWSFTTAQLNDVDGIKTAIATATSAQTYDGTDLNGAALTGNQYLTRTPRTVTVTTASSAGSYTTASPIVVTGRRNGQVVTDDLTLTTADGGETVRGDQVFDEITEIAVPAQNDTSGQFEWGVADVAFSVLVLVLITAAYVYFSG